MATFLGLVLALVVVVYFVNKKTMAAPPTFVPKKVEDAVAPKPVATEKAEPVKKAPKKTSKKTGISKPKAKKKAE